MTIDEQTKEQITRLLIGGEKVALPYHTERIDRGGYNLFALGIMNVVGEGKRFDIVVGCDSFIKLKPEEETLPCPEEVNNWVEMNQRQITLPNNDHRVIGILVKVPRDAAAGIYVFNVGVRYPDGKLYGTLQKMYVEV